MCSEFPSNMVLQRWSMGKTLYVYLPVSKHVSLILFLMQVDIYGEQHISHRNMLEDLRSSNLNRCAGAWSFCVSVLVRLPLLSSSYRKGSFSCKAKDFKHLVALRALQGFFESCINPGFILIIGSWYTRQEQSSRILIIQVRPRFPPSLLICRIDCMTRAPPRDSVFWLFWPSTESVPSGVMARASRRGGTCLMYV